MQRRCPEGPPLAQAAARRPPSRWPAGWCWSWPWRCTPSAGRTLQRYAMGLLGHHGVAVVTRATKVVDVMGPRVVDASQPKPGDPAHRNLAVMATLTARGATGLVELRFEVDPKSSRHVLVLRGRGAGSTGLGHWQAGLDPRPRDPTGVGCVRHTSGNPQ